MSLALALPVSEATEAVTNSFSSTAWAITLVLVFGLFVIDFVSAARNPHEVSMREAGIWTGVYVAAAVIFGLTISFWGPEQTAEQAATNGGWSLQYLAGYITEKSLSVDNLFIFVLIFNPSRCPRSTSRRS